MPCISYFRRILGVKEKGMHLLQAAIHGAILFCGLDIVGDTDSTLLLTAHFNQVSSRLRGGTEEDQQNMQEKRCMQNKSTI